MAVFRDMVAVSDDTLTSRIVPAAMPDATSLLEDYRRGRSDPTTIVQSCLSRIERFEPIVNAWSFRASDVLAQAQASAERWRQHAPVGMLDGIPIILKDNLVSAGLPAAWGNTELARRVPTHDEIPVRALRDAGAIVLGKGNTPEFAVEGYTANDTFGVTVNPYDIERTPGGSSGGVVAAVAAGMAVAGIGTDGGGSIRRPAAYTGLWGLKPGIGSVPRGEGLPQVLLDFETVGPITRSARDLALFHAVLSGQHGSGTMMASERLPSRALSILVVSHVDDAPCDPGVLACLDATAEQLTRLGHRLTRGALPVDLAPLNAIWSDIADIGLAHLASQDPPVLSAAAEKYQDRARAGSARTAVALYEALMQVFSLREKTRGLWGYDAVLTPAVAAMPWAADEAFPQIIDGQPVGPRGHAVYTGWVNAAGLPALALPAGTNAGLPVGMQLVAGQGQEAQLLSVAMSLASSD